MPKDTETQRKRSWFSSLIGPAVALLVCVGVAAIVKLLPGRQSPEPQRDEPVVNVSVMPVAPIDELVETMTHKAVAEAWTMISLSAETEGRIKTIDAAEGDIIKPGQTIIRLNDTLQQADYQQALVGFQLDSREAERVANAAGAASSSEKDVAESKVAKAKAVLEAASERLDRTEIRAPRAMRDPSGLSPNIGRLDRLPVEIGEYVSPGEVVAVIVDTSALRIIVDAPERDISYISPGMQVEVVIEALNDRKLTGVVHYIETVADPATRTYRVEVKVANAGGDIRPGMFARVAMPRRTIENAIMIPLDAAIPLETGYEVYINDHGVARRRFVRLTGDLIRTNAEGITEILVHPPLDPKRGPGLQAGNELIINGQRLVADGQLIAIQPTGDRSLPAQATEAQAAGAPAEEN